LTVQITPQALSVIDAIADFVESKNKISIFYFLIKA